MWQRKVPLLNPGATVVTDQFTFFTGISGEQFEVEGGTIVRISTSAPIYTSMKGLQKGSSFKFNETDYVIEEVY
jgi:hypothetical protein